MPPASRAKTQMSRPNPKVAGLIKKSGSVPDKKFFAEDQRRSWEKRREPSRKPPSVLTLGNDVIDIYTDGACSGNPAREAGALLRIDGRKRNSWRRAATTNNNRIELLAGDRGAAGFTQPVKARVSTQILSMYKRASANGFTAGNARWKQPGRSRSRMKIYVVDALASGHTIEWH